MEYPKVLYQFKDCAGEAFRPSNGTEGMIFIDAFCDNCLHEHADPDKKPKCDILSASFCFDVNDPEYPKEWRYSNEGWPICTKFQKWDWGRDGDPWDPDNPNKPPDPPDPNQLELFPLSPNETDFNDDTRIQTVLPLAHQG